MRWALCILLLVATSADAATRYVTSNGSNAHDGLTPATAWASLQYAVDQLSDGSPHTIYLGAGVTHGNSRLELDAANQGADLTVIGSEPGASLDNTIDATATTTQVLAVNSGCNAGTFRFQRLDINHSHTANSWAVRMNNAGAVGLRLEFADTNIAASHHGLAHLAPGVVSYSLSGCTLDYGSSGFICTQNGATLTLDNTTVNAQRSPGACIASAGGILDALIVRNGCVLHGGVQALDLESAVANLTLDASTFHHHGTADGLIDAQASASTSITGCTFIDNVGLAAAGRNFLLLRNGAGGVRFTGNTVSCLSPTRSTSVAFAVRIIASGTGPLDISDNQITSGNGGIWVEAPTVDGATGAMDRNTVQITCSAYSDTAHALVVGSDISATPAHTFGAWTMNDNTVRYTGQTGGIAARLGSEVRGPASEQARNLLLCQTAASPGKSYGFYNLAHNLHCHHNRVYARSACTFIGPQNCIIEDNDFISPAPNSKGVGSFNKHNGGLDPADSIIRRNFFLALFDAPENYALHVEGNPTNLQVDRNWYGIVGQPSLTLQNITALTPAPTLADAQARWNALGGSSTGSDSESLLNTFQVFVDPSTGDFRMYAQAVDILHTLSFPVGATPIPPPISADLDADGDVDSADLAIFTACLDGPAPESGTCAPSIISNADASGDGDLDLEDFAAWQRLFSP